MGAPMSHTDTVALDLLDAGRELAQEIERQKRANQQLLNELEESLRALRELVDRPLSAGTAADAPSATPPSDPRSPAPPA